MIILDTNCFSNGIINIDNTGMNKELQKFFEEKRFHLLNISVIESYKHIVSEHCKILQDYEKILSRIVKLSHISKQIINIAEQIELGFETYKAKVNDLYEIIDDNVEAYNMANQLICKYVSNTEIKGFIENKNNYLDLLILCNSIIISRDPKNKFEQILLITNDNNFKENGNKIINLENINNLNIYSITDNDIKKFLDTPKYTNDDINNMFDKFIKLLQRYEVTINELVSPIIKNHEIKYYRNYYFDDTGNFMTKKLSFFNFQDDFFFNTSGELLQKKLLLEYKNVYFKDIQVYLANLPDGLDKFGSIEMGESFELINYHTIYISTNNFFTFTGDATYKTQESTIEEIIGKNLVCDEIGIYYINLNFIELVSNEYTSKSDLISKFKSCIKNIS